MPRARRRRHRQKKRVTELPNDVLKLRNVVRINGTSLERRSLCKTHTHTHIHKSFPIYTVLRNLHSDAEVEAIQTQENLLVQRVKKSKLPRRNPLPRRSKPRKNKSRRRRSLQHKRTLTWKWTCTFSRLENEMIR